MYCIALFLVSVTYIQFYKHWRSHDSGIGGRAHQQFEVFKSWQKSWWTKISSSCQCPAVWNFSFILAISHYLPLSTQWLCTNPTTSPSLNRVTGPPYSPVAMPMFIMFILLVSNSSIFNENVLMSFHKFIWRVTEHRSEIEHESPTLCCIVLIIAVFLNSKSDLWNIIFDLMWFSFFVDLWFSLKNF